MSCFGSIHIRRADPKKKVCNFVGGVVSPILSNIYMDRLDKFVEETLIPEYTRGEKREVNPAYKWKANQAAYYRARGNLERAETIRREMQQLPSGNPNDPGYRRLRYIRYADDFLLGFIGPMTEAKEIKERITTFLRTELKLTLSAEKTLMTHAHTGKARFLGYEIGIMHSPDKFDNHRRRSSMAKSDCTYPRTSCRQSANGISGTEKPIHRPELLNDSDYDIIARYQGEYRGLVQLLRIGTKPCTARLRKVDDGNIAPQNPSRQEPNQRNERSQASPRNQHRRQKARVQCLKLTIPREGKKPLVATFGGLSLKRVKHPVIKDQVITPYPRMRSEIIERLLHDTCEVCGSKEHIEMHHIRKLADLNKEGRREKPLWMKIMISRKRKSIPLCRRCHDDIHSNRPKSKRQGNRRAG